MTPQNAPQPRPEETIHHRGSSSARHLRFWMPFFTLFHRLLIIVILLVVCRPYVGGPYFRTSLTHDRFQIVSATYWGLDGRFVREGHCPFFLWIKGPRPESPSSSE